MTQHDMDLRRAAILVASLDQQTADSLLEALPSAKAEEIRHAVMSLPPIDPVEQQLVIEQFLAGEADRSDVVATRESVQEPREDPAIAAFSEPHTITAAETSLNDGNVGRLAQLLQYEQPLTIAACLSRLTPTQAATVVQSLPRDVRGRVLKHTAELQSADPDALSDIDLELNHLLRQDDERQTRASEGVARLQAMLHHLNSPDRQMLVDDLARHDRHLATHLSGLGVSQVVQNPSQEATFQAAPVRRTNLPSPSLEFHDLRLADDAALAELFQRCDFETAVLAIAGATERVADELLGRLPIGIARRLRRRLADPGPIRLRDITVAQASLTQLAEGLHAQGIVRIPLPDHRFVASA